MKRISRTTLTALVASAMVLSAAGARALAAEPAVTCESTKLGAAAKYALCRLKADAKAVKKGLPVDYTKCNLDKFATAEVKAGPGVCPTEGDQTALQEGVLDPGTSKAAGLLHGARFADNGDGTVTDYDTGLMWEMKDELGGLHDVGNTYTWSLGAPWESSGSAFTTFLYRVNGGDGGTCLADHCDWRLPTKDELLTIADLDAPGCGYFRACIDPIFGPTQNARYWSSTTNDLMDDPSRAWFVEFNPTFDGIGLYLDCDTFDKDQSDDMFVRAVRAAF